MVRFPKLCFDIDSATGAIKLSQPLNYETAKQHSIVVKAKSAASSAVDEINVSVVDINDNNPIFSPAAYSVNINENMQLGQRIVQVRATDADSSLNGNNRITYGFKSPSTLFAVDSSTGLITLLSNALNAEVLTSYRLTVTAVDNGTPPLPATDVTVDIEVKDVNDNSPSFQKLLYQVSVNENSSVNFNFLNVSASDSDLTGPYNQLRYTIDQPLASQFFQIDDITGAISLKQKLDYKVRTRYDFQVIAY